jgi:hypothetical protein
MTTPNPDHGKDCVLCYNLEAHDEPQPFTDQDMYEALTSAQYLLGARRNSEVTTSAWGALSRDLNWLSMVADDRYQARRAAHV